MTTFQITCFLEAAKCLNFSSAAENLYVSQPTLSRNVASLETDLGIRLFERGTFHRVKLTESGKIMQTAFQKMDDILQSALSRAEDAAQQKPVKMMFGLLSGQLLDNDFSEMLSAFRGKYPNVIVKIKRFSYRDLMEGLKNGKIDCGYMPKWQFEIDGILEVMPVSRLETVLMIPKKWKKKYPEDEYSITELSDMPFISVNDRESKAARIMLLQLCKENGFEPKVKYVGSIEEQIENLEMGDGAVPINTLNSVCYSPNVSVISIREFEPQTFALGWKCQEISDGAALFKSFAAEWHINPEAGNYPVPDSN